MQLKNDLWVFALNFYQQPQVEANCLMLQNHYGLSVNRLIFACWSGVRGIRLTPERLNSAADDWQAEVTHPLRKVRYQVRKERSANPQLDECYQALRQAELKCEQVELALLFEMSESWQNGPASALLAEENMVCYLKSMKLPISTEIELAFKPLLNAVIAYLGTNPDE